MAHIKEFQITDSLNHKNIVKSFEFFDNGALDEIHQVMEFVEGIEVLDAISEQPHGFYTEKVARDLFK